MEPTEIDARRAKIIRLIWSEGTQFDPPGYYALIAIEGQIHHVFIESKTVPPKDGNYGAD